MTQLSLSRREFVKSGLAATALSAAPALGTLGANERIRAAVIGTGGRGTLHVNDLTYRKDVELAAICDVDDAQLDKAAAVARKCDRQPERYKDFRHVLDRKDIDAVFIATCCHWHAIPAVQAMKAGKDVFLEKPAGHTVHECRVIADTAKHTGRIVQIGTQQRSSIHWTNAVKRIRAGELGQVTVAHVWNTWGLNDLGATLGNPPDSAPPAGVDYDMWLGPAPRRPFNPARFHYSFYFHFDYSCGMTVAWGVHLFDVVAWALGSTIKSASSHGGNYVLKDGRDTPDALQATFDCSKYLMDYSLSHSSSWPRFGKLDHGIEFVGTKGVLQINRAGFEMFHQEDCTSRQPYYSEKACGDDTVRHQDNFFDSMRSRKQPHADAETGFAAALPGHLANISYRVGRSVRWDPKAETIPGDAEAARLLTKEYREPWRI